MKKYQITGVLHNATFRTPAHKEPPVVFGVRAVLTSALLLGSVLYFAFGLIRAGDSPYTRKDTYGLTNSREAGH